MSVGRWYNVNFGNESLLEEPLFPSPILTGKKRSLNALEGCVISAIAPCLAVLFTSPFDTAKVRLQLQGESLRNLKSARLAASVPGNLPAATPIVYRNSFDCIAKIFRHEGVVGLYKGLIPAICREGSKNLFRLGLFEPVMSVLHKDKKKSAPAWKRMIAGAFCGAVGAVSCNPFELVKTRLQSHADAGIAVGHQHQYSGMRDAFRQIVKQDGVPGLYKGSMLSVLRSIGGSGANLTVYSMTKEYLIESLGMKDSTSVDMVAGLWSGVSSCLVMNPFDVTRTRYYNQPFLHGKGQLYSSGLHAAQTIYRNEGPLAFYKGFTSHFLRIGPHFCLSFIFLGILRRSLIQYYDDSDMMHWFAKCDRDRDGLLDYGEVNRALRTVVPHSVFSKLRENDYDDLLNEYTSRVMIKADPKRRGVIDYDNFVQMAEEVRQILKETQIRNSFNELDRDGNGLIDKKDLASVLLEVTPAKQAQALSSDLFNASVAAKAERLIGALKQRSAKEAADYVTLSQFEEMVKGLDEYSTGVVLEQWSKAAGIGE